MLIRTHFTFAIFIFLISFSLFDNILLYLLFMIISTFFVDIDSKKSEIGKSIFARPLQFFVSHRGIIHSLIGGLLISSLFFLIDYSIGFGFLIGYLSHLFLDSLTVNGISLFYPFTKFKLRGVIRSGGIVEDILFVLLLLANIFIVFWKVSNLLF